MSGLVAVPITLREARVFVARHHRHHPAPPGGKYAIGAAHLGEVVGVVIVGQPVARTLADGWTAEVTRCCADGSRNVCSFLYAAAWRAARAMLEVQSRQQEVGFPMMDLHLDPMQPEHYESYSDAALRATVREYGRAAAELGDADLKRIAHAAMAVMVLRRLGSRVVGYAS